MSVELREKVPINIYPINITYNAIPRNLGDSGAVYLARDDPSVNIFQKFARTIVILCTLTVLIGIFIGVENITRIKRLSGILDGKASSANYPTGDNTSQTVKDATEYCPDISHNPQLTLQHNKTDNKRYRLVWHDEFDIDGPIDHRKWTTEIGGTGWGNNEVQYYTDRMENIRIQDGKLIIEARKEDYKGSQYTASRITSIHKGDWTYGKFYIRAKLPKVKGSGILPAIWM